MDGLRDLQTQAAYIAVWIETATVSLNHSKSHGGLWGSLVLHATLLTPHSIPQALFGNISINHQYRETMVHNNQYRRFFEEAVISHLQYITVYCNILQRFAIHISRCYNNAMSHNKNNSNVTMNR